MNFVCRPCRWCHNGLKLWPAIVGPGNTMTIHSQLIYRGRGKIYSIAPRVLSRHRLYETRGGLVVKRCFADSIPLCGDSFTEMVAGLHASTRTRTRGVVIKRILRPCEWKIFEAFGTNACTGMLYGVRHANCYLLRQWLVIMM